MYISARPGVREIEVRPSSDTAPVIRGKVGPVVVLLGLTSLLTDVSSEMVVAVLPLFATVALGLSPTAYGAIEGLYQGTTAVVRLAGGFAGDRTGRPKTVAAVGYGLSAVCKLALVPVSGGAALAAVLAADRTGKGLRTAPRDAMIAASCDAALLGRAFGVHRAMDTAGALLGPLVAFAVLAAIPGAYSTIFGLSFAIALVGLAVLVFLTPGEGRPARVALEPVSASGVAALVVDPRLRRLLVATGLLSVLTVGDGFLYLALLHRSAIAATYFPLLLVGTACAYMVLSVPLGRVADRLGRPRVFVAGHLALGLAYLAAAGPPGGAIGLCACLLLLGAYYAATDGVLAAAAASLTPPQLRGSGIALAQTAVALGRLVAAVAFGLAWSRFGRDQALVGFAVLLLVVAPLAALLFRVPSQRSAAGR